MRQRRLLKALPLVLVIIVLSIISIPGEALGWSAAVVNRTHKDIDEAAYKFFSADPAFSNVNFPAIDAIINNDYVNRDRTGPGPDAIGKSKASSHFYNPRLENVPGFGAARAGGGPDAVKEQFTNLLNAYKSGNAADAAKAAAWAAHFASDLYTPYHTQGIYREDLVKILNNAIATNAPIVELPYHVTGPWGFSTSLVHEGENFRREANAFLEETAGAMDKEDWFDPWYWDGTDIEPMLTSSHVLFEFTSFDIPGSWMSLFMGGVANYSPLWKNPVPSFDNYEANQAEKVREFARAVAFDTYQRVESLGGRINNSSPFLRGGIEAAASVWRASFSALTPAVSISLPDKNEPKKLKVVGTITNMAGEWVQNVQLRITVTGGTIKSGDKSPTIEYIHANTQAVLEWEVEAKQLGWCTFKMEVIGHYDKTPDMQYGVTEVTAPGMLPVSQTNPVTRDHSIVFCMDNSGSMDGPAIIDAMDAGVRAVDAMSSASVEMAVYFFGTYECDPPVRIVDFTLDRGEIKAAIRTASAIGNTPLAAAITAAGEYIRSNAQGEKATIILLTDGLETCNGDPIAAARALNPSIKLSRSFFAKPAYAANNIPISLQVIGFNMTGPDAAATLEQIAAAGNGKYYAATGVEELVDALTTVIEEATGKGIPVWWYIAGGAAFVLVLSVAVSRGKRARVPANTMASPSAGVQRPPQVARRPSTPSPTSGFFCQKCGSKVPAGASFCTSCGSPLVLAAVPATVPGMLQTYCPKCGYQNAAGNVFCGKCGSSLSPQNSAYCPQCGTPSVSGSGFCAKCGASLTANTTQPAVHAVQYPALTYCPQCGATNAAGSGFCNKCGSSMILPNVEPARAYSQTQAPAADKPSPLWWVLPFFLLLVGGLIAWAALQNRDRNLARRLLVFSLAWTTLVVVSYITSSLA
jgi:Mg-chelatase subunit ChlD